MNATMPTPPARSRPAQAPSANRPSRDRDIAHGLGEQRVRLAAGRRPHLLIGQCVAHDVLLLTGPFAFVSGQRRGPCVVFSPIAPAAPGRARTTPWPVPWCTHRGSGQSTIRCRTAGVAARASALARAVTQTPFQSRVPISRRGVSWPGNVVAGGVESNSDPRNLPSSGTRTAASSDQSRRGGDPGEHGPGFCSAREALDMVRAGLGYLGRRRRRPAARRHPGRVPGRARAARRGCDGGAGRVPGRVHRRGRAMPGTGTTARCPG